MKIQYKKKRLYSNLFLGVIWTALSTYSFYENSDLHRSDYLTLAIGIIYLSIFCYDNFTQYLTLKNDILKLNAIFNNNQINLKEVKEIKSFAGDYILKSSNASLIINTTTIIDHISQLELNNELKKYNIEWIK